MGRDIFSKVLTKTRDRTITAIFEEMPLVWRKSPKDTDDKNF